MVTMDSVLDVIQDYYPYPWAKDRQLVLNWVIWFIKNRFAVCVSDDQETISGLALFRPVMRPKDGETHYRFDPEGSVIYCDFLYAAHDRAMRGLIVEGTHRFGARTTAAWTRRGELRSYPAQRFVYHILKENHHVST
jgi:hypothetical protein